MKQNSAGCGQEAAECGQDAEEFGAGQKYPPPPVRTDFLQKSGRISCRKELETPLAAGLAAGAGELGSLEALAVHPVAQEFLYAATWMQVPTQSSKRKQA